MPIICCPLYGETTNNVKTIICSIYSNSNSGQVAGKRKTRTSVSKCETMMSATEPYNNVFFITHMIYGIISFHLLCTKIYGVLIYSNIILFIAFPFFFIQNSQYKHQYSRTHQFTLYIHWIGLNRTHKIGRHIQFIQQKQLLYVCELDECMSAYIFGCDV